MPSDILSSVEFNSTKNSILVECKFVNREKSLNTNLVLDTGATTTIISWYLSNSLGLEPALSKEAVPFFTASGKIEAPLVRVEEVWVGSVVVKKLEVIVHDLPQESGVIGLLGLNFLRNFEVKLDFRKGRITLNKWRK